jgi:hypothetical protein
MHIHLLFLEDKLPEEIKEIDMKLKKGLCNLIAFMQKRNMVGFR